VGGQGLSRQALKSNNKCPHKGQKEKKNMKSDNAVTAQMGAATRSWKRQRIILS
jgi:hypothetical protein